MADLGAEGAFRQVRGCSRETQSSAAGGLDRERQSGLYRYKRVFICICMCMCMCMHMYMYMIYDIHMYMFMYMLFI